MYLYEDGLESERLVTQFLKKEDSEQWLKFLKNNECTKFFPKYPHSDEQRAEDWINRQLIRYEDKTYGLQAIIEKSTNQMIGQCGLLAQEVDGRREIEVGYHFLKEHWGKGYAPEAALLFINYAFENTICDSIISIIHHQNLNSQKVALKNGLTLDKETSWLDMKVHIYRKKFN